MSSEGSALKSEDDTYQSTSSLEDDSDESSDENTVMDTLEKIQKIVTRTPCEDPRLREILSISQRERVLLSFEEWMSQFDFKPPERIFDQMRIFNKVKKKKILFLREYIVARRFTAYYKKNASLKCFLLLEGKTIRDSADKISKELLEGVNCLDSCVKENFLVSGFPTKEDIMTFRKSWEFDHRFESS